MLKLLAVLFVAAVVAHAVVAVPATVDSNDVDEDADFDLEDFDGLSDELDDEVAIGSCPYPCPAGKYQNSDCSCTKCSTGYSAYSPSAPFPNVGSSSCITCTQILLTCPIQLEAICGGVSACVPKAPGALMTIFKIYFSSLLGHLGLPLPVLPVSPVAPVAGAVANRRASVLRRGLIEEDVEVEEQGAAAACGISSIGCCASGFFGPDGNTCKACPSTQPSSPSGPPTAACTCSNALSTTCRGCSACEIQNMGQCYSKCQTAQKPRCSLTSTKLSASVIIPAGTCY
jgi:hypothetical protein